MPYVTQAQLIDRFGEQMLIALTDRGPDAFGVVDPDVVTRALAETDALIDGYLAGRYALPLTASETLLANVAGSIAIYLLHRYEAPEKVVADYKLAIGTLEQIARGTIRLTSTGAELPATGVTGVQIVDRERPFTEDNLKGFI
ncbi:MAG: gp436 family protein [Tabrizicola sp.]